MQQMKNKNVKTSHSQTLLLNMLLCNKILNDWNPAFIAKHYIKFSGGKSTFRKSNSTTL